MSACAGVCSAVGFGSGSEYCEVGGVGGAGDGGAGAFKQCGSELAAVVVSAD